MRRFYGHFAAAYGTCWLLLWLLALVTGSRLNFGPIGFIGLLAVGFVYALFRARSATDEIRRLRASVERLEARLTDPGSREGDFWSEVERSGTD